MCESGLCRKVARHPCEDLAVCQSSVASSAKKKVFVFLQFTAPLRFGPQQTTDSYRLPVLFWGLMFSGRVLLPPFFPEVVGGSSDAACTAGQ